MQATPAHSSSLIPTQSKDCFTWSKVCSADNSDLKKKNKEKQVLSGRVPRQPPVLFSHTWFYMRHSKSSTLVGRCDLINPKAHECSLPHGRGVLMGCLPRSARCLFFASEWASCPWLSQAFCSIPYTVTS